MENIGEALAAFPELAPGIIIGTLIGLGIGIYKDVKTDEFGNWWQLGDSASFWAPSLGSCS